MGLCRTLSSAVVATLVIAGIGPAMVGCGSAERRIYRSTPNYPQTVTLVDTRTGESVWSVDVPVGHELKISFMDRPDRQVQQGYDRMIWAMGPRGTTSDMVKSEMRVPQAMFRRLDGVMSTTANQRARTGSDGAQTNASTGAAAANNAPEAGKPAVVLPDPQQPAPK